jgi:hypothetical protein
MTDGEEVEVLEAILAALAVRAGGRITLPVREVADCVAHYLLDVWPARDGEALIFEARPVPLRLFPSPRRRKRRRPRRRGGGHRQRGA